MKTIDIGPRPVVRGRVLPGCSDLLSASPAHGVVERLCRDSGQQFLWRL